MREAHCYLGLTYARMGRKDESTEQVKVATRLEHEEAVHRRAVLCGERQDNGGRELHHEWEQ